MDAAPRPVLSLDIPAGLHTDTGLPMGAAVHADLTVTFVGLKLGLYVGEGANYRGALEFAGLGIPAAAHAMVEPPMERLTGASVRAMLPPRHRTAHKGTRESAAGGGRPGYVRRDSSGSEAALRSGAGVVRVATIPTRWVL